MGTHIQIIVAGSERLMESPRAARPQQRETKVRVICQTCGFERWLTKADAERAVRNSACRREAARRGYDTTMKRYGREYAHTRCRLRQLENPPSSEREMTRLLVEHFNLTDMTEQTDRPITPDNLIEYPANSFRRQVRFYANDHFFLLDYIIGTSTALEVNGFWHERDYGHIRRDAALATLWPDKLITIDANLLVGSHSNLLQIIDDISKLF